MDNDTKYRELLLEPLRKCADYSPKLGQAGVGSDGNPCFTEYIAGKIGRITTGGAFAEFQVPFIQQPAQHHHGIGRGIAAGPDHRAWFTEANGNKIGALRPSATLPHLPS